MTASAGPWVRTGEELERLVDELRGCRTIALDSESDSLHHHREKVCLVQVAEGGRTWLVDPLALRDLGPLAPLISDAQVTKVFHGADYDVTTMKRDFGFAFAGLFDTMIAARFLGLPAVGLQAVALSELGIALSKDSQKDDWSRRPLTPTQERYARDDVRHLHALRARLADRLADQGRLAWVQEECDAVAALPAAQRRTEPDAWQKVKGVRQLPPRAREVVKHVVAWRDAVAEETDVPAFRILNTDGLFALARNPPRDEAALRGVRAIWPRWKRQAPALLAAVERALAAPEADLATIPPAPRPPQVPPETKRRVDALRAWRTREAERLALDISIVLPQRLLEKVAEAHPRSLADLERIEGLRRWRVAALGDSLLRALA
ncbi:MAG TPA: HRDC domain-containing protein [Vicinamibacteria bacterium]|nr:HRDC domain-containing protein [Vicinamibacteria bacterium]